MRNYIFWRLIMLLFLVFLKYFFYLFAKHF